MRRRAVVIALQHGHRIGIGADDGDLLDLGPVEREDAVILQQHQRLPRDLQGKLPMFRGVVLVNADLGIRAFFGRIKQPEPEAGPQGVIQAPGQFPFP